MNVIKSTSDWELYPANPQVLYELILQLINSTEKIIKPTLSLNPRILISPNAWYMFSWTVASAWYILLRRNPSLSRIIIIGSSQDKFKWCWVCSYDKFSTPLWTVDIDKEINSFLLTDKSFNINNDLFIKENSIESQIPFLQTVLQLKTILPVVISPNSNIKPLIKYLIQLLKNDEIGIVISENLSKNIPYEQAIKKDSETIKSIMEDNLQSVDKNVYKESMWLTVAANLAKSLSYNKQFIHYANSWDTYWDKSNVVGYLSMIFWN